MGNLLPAEQRASRRPGYHLNELEVVEAQFYEDLRRRRRERFEKAWQQARYGRHDSQEKRATDVSKWPGWDSTTLQNLSNLFELYFRRESGLLEEERANALCVDLGDKSAPRERRVRFNAADADGDGWIDFEELLSMLYTAGGTSGPEAEEVEVIAVELEAENREGSQEFSTAAPLADEDASYVDEEASITLRPLALSCYENSQRAAVLAAMPAQTQIQYGFL